MKIRSGLVLLLSFLLLIGICPVSANAEDIPLPGEAPTEADFQLLEDLFSANAVKSVLSRHSRMELRQDVYQQEDIIGTYTVYIDADTYCSDSTSGFSLLLMRDTYLEKYTDRYDVYFESFLDSISAYEEELSSHKDSLSLMLAPDEALLSLQDDGQAIYAVTESEDADVISGYLSSNFEFYGAGPAYEEGMKMRWAYYFDSTSKDLQAVATLLQTADGKIIPYMFDSYIYDGAPFDASASPFADYFASDYLRSINVVFNAGSRFQHQESYSIPSGAYFDIMLNGDFVKEFYYDSACTHPVPFEDTATIDNITLYVKADPRSKL